MFYSKVKTTAAFFCFAFMFVGFLSLEASAKMASGVSVSPPRQEIKAGQRYAAAALLNRSGDAPIGYSITLIPLRMKEDGKLFQPEKLTKRESIAKSMIKCSPKRAAIPAGGKQDVRILVRRPAGLPDGEYMVYMRVTPSVQKETAEVAANPSKDLSIKLETVVGMSTPIIVYQGNPTAVPKLAGAELVRSQNGNSIKVTIDRSGNRSSYPGVRIYSIAGGKKELIGELVRIPIFVPLKRRTQLVHFKKGITFNGGPVLIEMTDFEDKDKGVIDSMKANL